MCQGNVGQSTLISVRTWQSVLQENQQRYIDEFIELLRIPSVSTAAPTSLEEFSSHRQSNA
jgi:hypothetical protein